MGSLDNNSVLNSLEMDGENSKAPQSRNSPPQTMGEASSDGKSVVGDPRSVQKRDVLVSDSCDGQSTSRMAALSPESNHCGPVENGGVNPAKGDGSGVASSASIRSTENGEALQATASSEALRLFGLKGVRRSKVAEILGAQTTAKTRELGDAYMSLFDFEGASVVDSLRILLERCSISGETQAQERIVQFFSRRFAACNKTVGDADAVHSLTAAVMLLNQDLHGQNLGKKMTSSQFSTNVALLRDGKSPIAKAIVKEVYAQIKSRPLQFTHDDEENVSMGGIHNTSNSVGTVVLPNSVVEVDLDEYPTVIREGLLKRKNVGGGFGQRHWSLRYCVVRGFILHLFKTDNKGVKAVPNFADLSSAIILTHALAMPAVKYNKRPHCLQLLDSAGVYHLFQASTYDDLTSWVVAINRAAAIHSSKPLAAPCGSSADRFERPPLPKHPTKATPEENLAIHKEKVDDLIKDIAVEQENRPSPTSRNKHLVKVWEARCQYMTDELVRYQSYVEAMTLDHDFAPTAKRAAELLSPSQSVSSIASTNSAVSVRSMRRSNRQLAQSSSVTSTEHHQQHQRQQQEPQQLPQQQPQQQQRQSMPVSEALTPPPGSGSPVRTPAYTTYVV